LFDTISWLLKACWGSAMFKVICLCFCAIVAISGGVAQAASKQDHDDCGSRSTAATADRNIAACTRIINDRTETRNHGWAYGCRCVEWMTKGDYNQAVSDCGRATKLTPNVAINFYNRGRSYGAMKDDRALADFTRAIKINPKHDESYRERAEIYVERRQFDKAICDYTKAINIDPKDANYYNGRAWAYFKASKAALGLPDAQRALELRPDDANALDTRGHIYEALGKRDEAIADFRKALATSNRADLQQSGTDALKRLGAAP
jgi:tetratricopeptide (TPR) repeat protein